MTRTLVLLVLLTVLLLPATPSMAFESPLLFESPLSPSGDGDGVIWAQAAGPAEYTYILPTVRVGGVGTGG